MKMVKRVSFLALALVLALSLSVTAFAATSSVVEYSGHNIFGFKPGSEYTSTDLFDNFKGVMPGDTLTETVTVTNTARCCDYIKVYLRAVPHDDEKNPLSPNVAKEETVVSMSDFLKQLTMTVKQGDKVIFSGQASELDGLQKNVLLGTLRRNKSVQLDVTLGVPLTLGNEYANRVGEVDWLFTIEEYNDGSDTPKTGDETNIVPYVALLAVGAAGMLLLLVTKKKKQAN